MSDTRFQQFAAYNRWANAKLYAAALALPDADYRRPVGVFFGSLHGTLNHILAADRIWLRRITGMGEAPDRLDTILHADRTALARARMAEDERIVALVASLDDEALAAAVTYANTRGEPQRQPLGDILAHVFNHQTHHRGQAHACLTILGRAEAPSLDMIGFQRGLLAPDLGALLAPDLGALL